MEIRGNFCQALSLSRVRVRQNDLYVTELRTESARQILRRREMRPVAELLTNGEIRAFVDLRDYREQQTSLNNKKQFDSRRAKEETAPEVSLLSVVKAAGFTVLSEQPVNESLADLVSTVLGPEAKAALNRSLSYGDKKRFFDEFPFSAFQLMNDEEQYLALFNAAGEGVFLDNPMLLVLAQSYLREKPNEGEYALLWSMIESIDLPEV